MPHVRVTDRACRPSSVVPAENVGQLTFQLTAVLQDYILERTSCRPLSQQYVDYALLAECLGALEGCRADFLDSVLVPYEQRKKVENGDVWRDLRQAGIVP